MNWTPDHLTLLATAYWQSATLMTAVELGVFDALADGPATAGELAAALAAAPGPMVALAEALVALGLLQTSGQAYWIAPSARPMLLKTGDASMVDALRYNADLYRHWAQLAGTIQTGEPVVRQQPHLGGDPLMTRRFVRGMEAKARAFSSVLAPLIQIGSATTLLDIGSGPGTLSRELLKTHPDLVVTLFDLPNVLAVAGEIIGTDPLQFRLAYHPGDYRAGPLPNGFDSVLFAGALHQETVESARALFTRCAAALRPGGQIFVVDLMLDADRTSPVFSSLFQLSMLLTKPDARVFSNVEVQGLLLEAGFIETRSTFPGATPYRIVSATLPP